MTRPLQRAALLFVIAALPLPFLLFAGVVEREALLWVFLSDLVVAVLAAFTALPVANAGRRWAFEKGDPD